MIVVATANRPFAGAIGVSGFRGASAPANAEKTGRLRQCRGVALDDRLSLLRTDAASSRRVIVAAVATA